MVANRTVEVSQWTFTVDCHSFCEILYRQTESFDVVFQRSPAGYSKAHLYFHKLQPGACYMFVFRV